MAENEVWRPVVGYEGLYDVSSLGNIRRLRDIRHCVNKVLDVPRQLNKHKTAGYLRAVLSRNGKKTMRLIHQLVLEAFVGPRPAGYESGHLNNISTDNRLTNLLWVTHSENELHKRANGTRLSGERHPHATLTAECVRSIRKLRATTTTKTLAEMYGVSRTTIQRIVSGERWQCLL